MSDRQTNPYITPESEIDTSEEEYAELRYFTPSGRLGRLRYIAYGVGANFLAGLVQAGAAGVAAMLGAQGGAIVSGVVGIAVIIGVLVLYTPRAPTAEEPAIPEDLDDGASHPPSGKSSSTTVSERAGGAWR